MSVPGDPATRAPIRVYIFPGQERPTEDVVKSHVHEGERWRRVEILSLESLNAFLAQWQSQTTSWIDFMVPGLPNEVEEVVVSGEYGITVIG